MGLRSWSLLFASGVAIGSFLVGCGGGGSSGPSVPLGSSPTPTATPTATPTPSPPNERLYVGGGTSVSIFSVNPDGSLTNIGAISGPHTGLQYVTGLATDRTGNVYAVNNVGQTASIVEFPTGSVGDVSPVATISGSNTGLGAPYGLDVDSGGHIFVANYSRNNVIEFAPGANANVAPIGQLSAPAPLDVRVDQAGRLYVTHGIQNGGLNGAEVFQSISATNVAATIPNSGGGAGIALAPNGDVYLGSNSGLTRYLPPINGTSYSAIATINTSGVLGVAVDTQGRIFVEGNGDFTTSRNGLVLLEFAAGLSSTAPVTSVQIGGWPVAVYPKP